MDSPDDAAAVRPLILAAGASARMGRPKALLDLGGRTCLARVLAAVRGAGLGPPIVVTAPGAAALRAHLEDVAPGAEVMENPRPEDGMLSSLQAGLRRLPAPAPGFLLFPVDYPLVEAEDVRALAAAFAARAPEARVFVPSFAGRRGHPVLVHRALAPALLALPPTASAREVMRAHAGQTVHVPVASDRVLVDMDTPEDYRRCLARLGLTPSAEG